MVRRPSTPASERCRPGTRRVKVGNRPHATGISQLILTVRAPATLPRRSVTQPRVVFVGCSGSVEEPRLGRRPARQPPGSFRRDAFPIEVSADLLDHHGIHDARVHPHRPTPGRAGLHVEGKAPFQALCPGYLGSAFGQCQRLPIPVEARRPPLPRLARVTPLGTGCWAQRFHGSG